MVVVVVVVLVVVVVVVVVVVKVNTNHRSWWSQQAIMLTHNARGDQGAAEQQSSLQEVTQSLRYLFIRACLYVCLAVKHTNTNKHAKHAFF